MKKIQKPQRRKQTNPNFNESKSWFACFCVVLRLILQRSCFSFCHVHCFKILLLFPHHYYVIMIIVLFMIHHICLLLIIIVIIILLLLLLFIIILHLLLFSFIIFLLDVLLSLFPGLPSMIPT